MNRTLFLLNKHGRLTNLISASSHALQDNLSELELTLIQRNPEKKETINKHTNTILQRADNIRKEYLRFGDELAEIKETHSLELNKPIPDYLEQLIDHHLYSISSLTSTIVDNVYRMIGESINTTSTHKGAIAKQLKNTNSNLYEALDNYLYKNDIQKELREVRNSYQHGFLEHKITPALSSPIANSTNDNQDFFVSSERKLWAFKNEDIYNIEDFYIEHEHSNDVYEVQDLSEILYLNAIDQIVNLCCAETKKKLPESLLEHKLPLTSDSPSYKPY